MDLVSHVKISRWPDASRVTRDDLGNIVTSKITCPAGVNLLVEEPLITFRDHGFGEDSKIDTLSNEQLVELLNVVKRTSHLLIDINKIMQFVMKATSKEWVLSNEKLARSLLALEGDNIKYFIWMRFLIDADADYAVLFVKVLDRYRIFKLLPLDRQARILHDYGTALLSATSYTEKYQDRQFFKCILARALHESVNKDELWQLLSVDPDQNGIAGLISDRVLIRYRDATCIDEKADSLSIFDTTWRVNHSCFPNAKLSFNRGKCVLRSIRAVVEGEEVTIDYGSDETVGAAALSRNHQLRHTKGIDCSCVRCSSSRDDTRRFSCELFPSTSCLGFHFVCQPGRPILCVTAALTPCLSCNHIATTEFTTATIKSEMESFEKFEKIKAFIDRKHPLVQGGIVREMPLDSLKIFRDKLIGMRNSVHPLHFISFQIGALLRTMTSMARGNVALITSNFTLVESPHANRQILVDFQKERECLDAIIQFPHQIKEAFYIMEAGSLRSLRNTISDDPELQQEFCMAEIEAFQRYFRVADILGEGMRETFYIKYKELKHSVYPMLHAAQIALGRPFPLNQCAVCAATERERTLMRCERCRSICYCGIGHQKLAWPTHKSVCVPRQ